MMQVKISPDLVKLLEEREEDEHNEVLVKLWRKVEKEVEQQKELLHPKKQDIIASKRARFSFD